MNRRPAVVLLAAVALCASSATEPSGYRMEDYRTAVPATLAGAVVVDTTTAMAIHRDGSAVFIDVLPRPPKPAGLPPGTPWRDRPHDGIPGSVWLPNVGYGALAPEVDAYYRHHLDRLTAGDRGRPLVVFCLAECWMSWNAAKRAVSYGYTRVHWYPDGTDGWQAADGQLVPVEPAP